MSNFTRFNLGFFLKKKKLVFIYIARINTGIMQSINQLRAFRFIRSKLPHQVYTRINSVDIEFIPILINQYVTGGENSNLKNWDSNPGPLAYSAISLFTKQLRPHILTDNHIPANLVT